MAAPTIECTCPYEILSRKNRNYNNVWDLAPDRDAATGAAITFDVKFPKCDVIGSCGYENYC